MYRRWVCLLVLGALLVGSGVAVAQNDAEPRFGGTLRVAQNADVNGLDTHLHTAHVGNIVLSQIHEPLFAYDSGTQIQPVLVENTEISDDGKTYIFDIVQGRKFHDGTELTAEDVKYSYDFTRLEGARTQMFDMIDNIEILGRYRVAFHLNEAGPSFMSALAFYSNTLVVSKDHAIAQREEYGVIREPVGTGPYKFREWIPDARIVLERFEDYEPLPRGPASGLAGERIPYLDEIIFLPMPEDAARVVAVETGQVHVGDFVPPSEAERLDAMPNPVIKTISGSKKTVLNFDHRPPFDDVRMRRAVALALDYEELVEAVMWGYGEVNNSFVTAVEEAFRTPVHDFVFDRDLDEARRLLEEVGYDGRPVKVYGARIDQELGATPVMLQEQLGEVGINVDVEYTDLTHLLELWYDAGMGGGMGLMWWPFRPDPSQNYWRTLCTSEHNPYCNEEYDAIVERANNSTDLDERRRLYEEAQLIFWEDVPMLPLFDSHASVALDSAVRGFASWAPAIHPYWGVWLDE